jgi:hypothetical protein
LDGRQEQRDEDADDGDDDEELDEGEAGAFGLAMRRRISEHANGSGAWD